MVLGGTPSKLSISCGQAYRDFEDETDRQFDVENANTLLATVVLVPSAYSRPLTMAERGQFERTFYPECLDGPHIKEMIVRRGGVNEHRKYCSCAGHYFARTISSVQAANPQKLTAEQHATAMTYCLKQVFAYSRAQEEFYYCGGFIGALKAAGRYRGRIDDKYCSCVYKHSSSLQEKDISMAQAYCDKTIFKSH
jgi:hypothetical protein